jgi:hypothetical protein
MNTTIRELVYADRRKLSEMIRKLSVRIGDDSLMNQIVSNPKKHESEEPGNDSHLVKVGLNLFNQLLQFLEDDITEWFADLVGVTVDTYLAEAPFDIEITIIDQLMDEKGKFRTFLFGASKLYKRIKTSIDSLKEKNA